MKCPRCQQDNPTHARFCLGCGARLALACGSCGAELPGGARFCLQCGLPVAVGTAAPVRSPAPETYTPKHLAEKILTSKSALEGERKQVTVLFADMKGSMELLADRDPEEARKLLDPVLEHMMDAVHRYEGTVNQVMGDGIMALFGAPLAHEDHAVRACYAAVKMQESVKRYAESLQRTEGIPVRIRIGLNSGEVVVRSIGSDLRMDYTAVGQTTHLAARMEQIAAPGSILITDQTLNLIEGYLQVKGLGPMPIKGLDTPVEVYEVLGSGTVRSRLHATAVRGFTRFAGRDGELDRLRQALEQARSENGQVVAIVGEPGVGKSRLQWEFTHSNHTKGWLILESGSVSYGKATPYLPVIDLLKTYFQIEGQDTARTIYEKVTGKLFSLDRQLEPLLPAFLGLLDVPPEDAQWERLDPAQRRQRTLDGVKRLLLRESQVQPLLLIFEDLHWIDGETQALLDSLVESLPMERVLLIVSYRPQYQHDWGSNEHYRQLQLDPFPVESARELLKSLLGSGPDLELLTARLIAWTGGNPFFLEESVKTLIETGVLAPEEGSYRLARPLHHVVVPPSVQAVLAARIDRLAPEDKHLLQSAAVIGKDVPFDVLEAISELPVDQLRLRLTRLQSGGFLYEASLSPDLECTFRHALTHEVAYGSLLHEHRQVLHVSILEAIERLHASHLDKHVERLAHHALNARRWVKALAYFRQAASKASARSAHLEAVAFLEQALLALSHLPESRDRTEHAIDLRFDLRSALHPLGEFSRILEYLRETEALAEALEDPWRLGRASAYITQYFWWMGDPDRAIISGQRAFDIAAATGDFALEVIANFALGVVYHSLGEYAQAMKVLERGVESVQGDLSRERFGLAGLPSVFFRIWLIQCHTERGEFAAGLRRGEEGLRLAEAVDHPFSLIQACYGLGFLYVRKGELQRAIPVLERGLSLCQDWNIPIWFPRVASTLGYAYTVSGREAEGLSLLEGAVTVASSKRILFGHSLALSWLSETYLTAGRRDDAIVIGQRALALPREHKERGYEAWALRLLGEVASRSDPLEAEVAEDYYQQGLDLAERLGMRPLVAHCHLGLGKLYRRTRPSPDAEQHHLIAATTLFRDMGMLGWAQQAERATFS
jgi:class 3 adenylate cyclase/tetratricopeptide (TPR) repeat protein